MILISAVGRQRQADLCEGEASLVYIERDTVSRQMTKQSSKGEGENFLLLEGNECKANNYTL